FVKLTVHKMDIPLAHIDGDIAVEADNDPDYIPDVDELEDEDGSYVGSDLESILEEDEARARALEKGSMQLSSSVLRGGLFESRSLAPKDFYERHEDAQGSTAFHNSEIFSTWHPTALDYEVLRRDATSLLLRFCDGDASFDHFVKCWQEKKFSLIFCTRHLFSTVRLPVNYLFYFAKKFLVTRHPLQLRIGGLFLLFALYTQQPAAPFYNVAEKIQLTLGELREVFKPLLADLTRAENGEEARFILFRLFAMEAFEFSTLPQKVVGPVVTMREARVPLLKSSQKQIREYFKDQMKDLSQLEEQYKTLKKAFEGSSSREKDDLRLFMETVETRRSQVVQFVERQLLFGEPGKRKDVHGLLQLDNGVDVVSPGDVAAADDIGRRRRTLKFQEKSPDRMPRFLRSRAHAASTSGLETSGKEPPSTSGGAAVQNSEVAKGVEGSKSPSKGRKRRKNLKNTDLTVEDGEKKTGTGERKTPTDTEKTPEMNNPAVKLPTEGRILSSPKKVPSSQSKKKAMEPFALGIPATVNENNILAAIEMDMIRAVTSDVAEIEKEPSDEQAGAPVSSEKQEDEQAKIKDSESKVDGDKNEPEKETPEMEGKEEEEEEPFLTDDEDDDYEVEDGLESGDEELIDIDEGEDENVVEGFDEERERVRAIIAKLASKRAAFETDAEDLLEDDEDISSDGGGSSDVIDLEEIGSPVEGASSEGDDTVALKKMQLELRKAEDNVYFLLGIRYVEEHKADFIQNLKEAVAIQSVSAWPQKRPEIKKMLEWAGSRLESFGAEIEYANIGSQTLPDGDVIPLPPVLLGSLGNDPAKVTLVLYGHLDVQPASKSDGWDTEPFELTEKDGKLFGRGASDDKGPVLGWIHVIEAFKNTGVDLPVNLKFVFEGMEESGSEGLDDLLEQRSSSFFKGVDYVCISDNYWLGTEKPCLTYGLRGNVYFFIEVECADKDLHSGVFGGVVHEAMADLVYLMNQLLGMDGKILIPGVYDTVAPLTKEEEELYEKMDFDPEKLRSDIGCKCLNNEGKKEAVLMAKMRNPTLSLHGIEGAFSDAGCKTVIPRKVIGKFSLRIVPNQTVEGITKLTEDYINSLWEARKSPNKMKAMFKLAYQLRYSLPSAVACGLVLSGLRMQFFFNVTAVDVGPGEVESEVEFRDISTDTSVNVTTTAPSGASQAETSDTTLIGGNDWQSTLSRRWDDIFDFSEG
ncbi:unnamed protein product, partial [Cyprideis torosa]